ncbi:MAG: PadR family transcriptional regulator [Acidimicrobiales bacterium]|nr:PadR family transcriptional regulator [Acidimicrobiales bacterium]
MLRNVLLGLLDSEPCYGYELKAVFENFLGGTWPLNIGQIYTSLAKLEDDGLVRAQTVPQDGAPDRKVYEVTAKGRRELAAWTSAVNDEPVKLRDELFLKVAVLSLKDSNAARDLIHRQRVEHLSRLAELGEMQDDPEQHPATGLLLEAAMLRTEAELKWLDAVEGRLKDWGGNG